MILIIFLDVPSAFHIKKSSHFICCFTMQNSLPVGFLVTNHEHTECAGQGSWVSAPPARILNQNFQIFRKMRNQAQRGEGTCLRSHGKSVAQ